MIPLPEDDNPQQPIQRNYSNSSYRGTTLTSATEELLYTLSFSYTPSSLARWSTWWITYQTGVSSSIQEPATPFSFINPQLHLLVPGLEV